MAQIVRQTGGLDEVGVAAEGGAQFAPHLGALQGVGQAGAGAGVPGVGERAGGDDLGLAGQPAQRGGVQDPGAVALEGGAAGAFVGLGDPAFGVRVGVAQGAGGLAGCRWCARHTATVAALVPSVPDPGRGRAAGSGDGVKWRGQVAACGPGPGRGGGAVGPARAHRPSRGPVRARGGVPGQGRGRIPGRRPRRSGAGRGGPAPGGRPGVRRRPRGRGRRTRRRSGPGR